MLTITIGKKVTPGSEISAYCTLALCTRVCLPQTKPKNALECVMKTFENGPKVAVCAHPGQGVVS
jgi:hypothetical protein